MVPLSQFLLREVFREHVGWFFRNPTDKQLLAVRLLRLARLIVNAHEHLDETASDSGAVVLLHFCVSLRLLPLVLCMCVCVCACVRACVYVCVRERAGGGFLL